MPAVLTLLTLLLLAGPSAAPARAVAAGDPRPNVLVIQTDDQRFDELGFMPTVERELVAKGTRFDNSFVEFSQCCPSRATLFTGQYSQNHRVLGLTPPLGGYVKLDSSNYLPLWLQAAGYRTAHLGKFLNGYGEQNPNILEVPPGWDDWEGSIDPTTYDYRDFTLNDNGVLQRRQGVYQTDFYGERASQMIEEAAADPRPFFLSFAPIGPHYGAPVEPGDPPDLKTAAVPARHQGLFENRPLPQPPGFNELDNSDKPAAVRRRVLMSAARIASVEEAYQQRLESLQSVDEAVGKVLDALQRTGQLERTLIIFTSDNGFLLGEHRIPQGKVVPYEPSIRVPLVMRGPGVPAGEARGQMVTNADLAPTILQATGALPGRIQDGRALQPLLADPGLEWGRDLLIRGRDVGIKFAGIRTPRWKYVRYGNGEQELYDLATDPYETQSRHADPAVSGIRRQLARRLADLSACSGIDCSFGPELDVTMRPSRGCVGPELDVSLTGEDSARLVRATVIVDQRRSGQLGPVKRNRRVATASVARGAAFPVRVRATLNDGRVVTVDRVRTACP